MNVMIRYELTDGQRVLRVDQLQVLEDNVRERLRDVGHVVKVAANPAGPKRVRQIDVRFRVPDGSDVKGLERAAFAVTLEYAGIRLLEVVES